MYFASTDFDEQSMNHAKPGIIRSVRIWWMISLM